MSAASVAALLWVFASPPPPTEPADEQPTETSETSETEAGGETPAPPSAVDVEGEGGGPPPPPSEAAPEGEAGPVETDELPRDSRYDPILPYGETDEGPELEYADETPPPPEFEYADEAPPSDDIEYDQSRQQQPPPPDALGRESDEQDDLGQDQFEGRVESPQRFAVEVKFGPYLPDVDRRYTGDGFGPYATIFGETDDLGVTNGAPKRGLFTVFSFEWQFVHLGGPFSLGTTVGIFGDRADALIVDDVAEGESVRSSADRTRFSVVPVTVLLGYRFELLADRFRVPLVPYARGGVAYGFWWERKGGTFATDSAGNQARGGSWGWQVNLGLMLRLDFLERASAVDLDRLTGINHTYLFGEWQFSRLDTFGSETAMSVGDDTFLLGLAFEF